MHTIRTITSYMLGLVTVGLAIGVLIACSSLVLYLTWNLLVCRAFNSLPLLTFGQALDDFRELSANNPGANRASFDILIV